MKTPISPVTSNITAREQALVDALRAIVVETMAYPVTPPQSADSYLPEDMILAGIRALGACGVALVCGDQVVEG